ncbi:MAG: ribosome recycling factor [bacterium]|nr:ribosome recycling factor [bacterium]
MELEIALQKTVDALKTDLNSIRTGRATPALVENVMAEVYGSKMRIMELATILAADAHTITIQPWDMGNLTPIRKGIEEANLGLNPQIDATNVIRITIPALTQERRIELVKRVKQVIEDHKIQLRMHRQDTMKDIERSEKEKLISEDEAKRMKEKVQKTLDDFIAKIDSIGSSKEEELMRV